MKDDFRNRKLSTNRTEVNIEQVRWVVRGNHQLTVHMITSQLDIKKDSVRKIITENLGMAEKLWDWEC